MLELAVLGSGSSGNSALVCLGDTRILVDAGLSARQIGVRLEALGVDPDSLSAIVLTHEHGDHTRGIDVFCRKRPLPVYGTNHTCAMLRDDVKAEVTWRQFEAGAAFQLGGIEVETFSVPHDAVDPVGFVFRCEHGSAGVLSDVGHVTRAVLDRLRGVNLLFAEANYDETMLQNDPKRPWATKQRIGNRHGHLSNDQTVELVRELAGDHLSRVVLGHLSSDCNTPELATALVTKALEENGCGHVAVECAGRSEPLPLRPVATAPASPPAPAVEEMAAPSARVCESDRSAPAPAASQEWRQMEWAF